VAHMPGVAGGLHQAQSTGLTCRPFAETVRETWEWSQADSSVAENERAMEIGLRPRRNSRS